jgi:hypothetical protein
VQRAENAVNARSTFSGEVRNGKSRWIYTSIDLHAFWML